MTARTRSTRSLVFALGAAILFVAPLRAQDASLAAPVPTPAVSSVPQPSVQAPAGPTMETATVAAKNVSTETKEAVPAAPGKYYDQGTKLMIVGGAAILTGIVVGGDAGHAISIVGAVVGLYGLYKYLQ
ncbi:MAG: hypothetical protein ABIT20_14545 [Gemmatimonadaceae bacterium]